MLMKNPHMLTSTGQAPAQADLLFLLADLLRRPAADRERWTQALEMLEDLLAAAGFAGDAAIRTAVGNALVQASFADADAWADAYHRLFEGAMLCPPNETAYVRRDKGAIIADVCGFYRAFGFRAEAGEKPDHIVTQLEFAGALLVMLAVADDAERREIVRLALEDFADAHLGEWLAPFATRLEETISLPLYVAAARALREVWQRLAEARSLRVATSHAEAYEPESDEPMECGIGGEAPVALKLNGQPVSPA